MIMNLNGSVQHGHDGNFSIWNNLIEGGRDYSRLDPKLASLSKDIYI